MADLTQRTWAGSFKFPFSSSTGILAVWLKKAQSTLGGNNCIPLTGSTPHPVPGSKVLPSYRKSQSQGCSGVPLCCRHLQLKPYSSLKRRNLFHLPNTSLQPAPTSHGHLLKSGNYQTCLAGFLLLLSEASLIAFPPQTKDLSTKIHRRAAGINLQLPLQKKEPRQVS